MLQENFVETMHKSISTNWDMPALSDYRGGTLLYSEVADKIVWLHHLFRKQHLRKGDKISLLGKNSANWAVVYLAAATYGAVIVPILADFHTDDIHHIVNHSESVLLFSSQQIYERIDETKMSDLEAIISLDNLGLLYNKKKSYISIFEKSAQTYLDSYKGGLSSDNLSFPKIGNDVLASLVYTSGTTGFSKGVMLPYNSLMGNVRFAQHNLPLQPGDAIVSFLPVAHCYACAFDFLFPFSVGAHITFLGKIPSPKIILQAFADVKPRLIMCVPLVIEKIYKKRLKATLDKGVVKTLLKLPVVSGALYGKIKKKLVDAFGGNFIQIIVGGAALNEEVEAFFKKIKFPITVGYGMSECGPLISYAPYDTHRPASVGKAIDCMEVRIDSPDPYNVVGEILTKGENVMYGYYKNKEATAEAIDKDGWLHTGDLGLLDKDGFVYIKGRCKTMLLGASGQNIYPEEIEARINNMPFVQESLVVERDGRLVALVYPDMERVDSEKCDEHHLLKIMEKNRQELNSQIAAYSAIAKFELYPEEFEKTPKKSIKRFLYTAG